MTLAQLRYAITVANSNSMNEAARTLFISQPSLSSAIRELEEEIGVELFRRTNRGISVTPEGEEFLGYARQVVEQYALIESKYVSKEHTKKKFSVSMQHYTFAVNAFVEMVKQFGMDEYEFAVHETRTYDIITDVKGFQKRDWNPLPERFQPQSPGEIIPRVQPGIPPYPGMQHLCLHVERPSPCRPRPDHPGGPARVPLPLLRAGHLQLLLLRRRSSEHLRIQTPHQSQRPCHSPEPDGRPQRLHPLLRNHLRRTKRLRLLRREARLRRGHDHRLPR